MNSIKTCYVFEILLEISILFDYLNSDKKICHGKDDTLLVDRNSYSPFFATEKLHFR